MVVATRKRRSRWTVTPYIVGAAHYAANRAGNYIGRRLGTYIRTKMRGNVKSGQGITTQRDRSNIYRRRRAPRRMRARKRRQMRYFKSKLLKMKGARTMITNQQVTVTSLPSLQSVSSFVLYGGRVDGLGGATLRGYDDMEDLRKRDYLLGDNTGDPEGRIGAECKWFTKTGVMDMTIQNVSENNVPIEMDVYEFYCGLLENDAGDDVETAIQFYNQDILRQGPATAQLQTLDQTDRGVTPFEFGTPMSKFRMKIVKKTKYFIPYGDCITYQIRDSKIRQFDHSVYRNNSPTTRHTRGVYIVAKPTAGLSSVECSYVVGCTRKYKYYVDQSNTVRAGYWDPVG